jgi:hypothetical protein
VVTERDRELGAYLVLYALLGVVFFTMAAIVLDIAALRQGRRADRATADLSTTAGVAEIDRHEPRTFGRACETAWGYVLANRTEASGAVTAPNCGSAFPVNDTCTGTMPARTATGTIGTITISITHPVPDSSPLMLAEAQGGDISQSIQPAIDGSPCERLAVRIVRDRTFLFGQIAGALGGTTDVHSVARALTTTSTTEVPAVVALDPTGCTTLLTDPGAGSLHVGNNAQAGLAIVDSDGSGCGAGSYVISAGAAGDGADRIRAVPSSTTSGQLRSFALAGANFAAAYDPGAVSDSRLRPRPEPTVARTTRRLIDERYRCATCAGGTDVITPYVANRSGPGAPPGTTATYAGGCTIPDGSPQSLSATHVYVDCDPFVIEGPVTFLGSSVTVAGSVIVTDTGCVAINDTSCGAAGVTSQDADVFVRGTFTKSVKGQVAFPRTFFYATGSMTVGVDEDTTVGNSTLFWTSPTTGPFEDLLFWTESAAAITLGEQRNTTLLGTFFAPNATVTLNPRDGGGVTTPLQVVASRVRLTGAGTYRLQPTPDRATGAFTRQVRLIR